MDDLWERCDRGDWLIWLAVVERLPLVSIVGAAVVCAERAANAMPKGRKRLLRAIESAQLLDSPDACETSAEACEEKADSPDTETYRTTPPTAYRWAAHSAALAARAAEGLLRAEVSRQGDRSHEQRERGALVGAGAQVMAGPDMQPLVFAISDEWSQFSVDAAASAVNAAARALLPVRPDDSMTEKVEGELSELVFEVLDPIRRALRNGADLRDLVDEVRPFGGLVEAGDEVIIADKKPLMAVLAGLIIPIGGGHYYADNRRMANVLSVGIITGLLVSTTYPFMGIASGLLILTDILLAPAAVRQRNQDDIPTDAAQLTRGAMAVVLAFAIALALR